LKDWLPPTFRLALNVGSGGATYGLSANLLCLDIDIRAVAKFASAVVADAHQMPVRSGAVDVCICVGSVLNYVSLFEVLSELARTLTPNGTLIVEYERSEAYITSSQQRHAIMPRSVTYRGEEHVCWFYSDSYVDAAITAVGLRIDERRYFHIASQSLVRSGFSGAFASVASFFDFGFNRLRIGAANAMIRCSLK
jgi:hypothetical protein